MAQPLAGDFPIDPQSTSGNDLADILNRLAEAAYSTFRGASRPSDATGGMLWVRTAAAGRQDIIFFDGAQDVTLFQVDASGTPTTPFTYTQTEIDQKIATAAAGVQGSVVNSVAAGSGLVRTGGATTPTLAHQDTSGQGSVNNSAGTVVQDVSLDTYGHVTNLGSVNLDQRYFTQGTSDGRYLRRNVTDTSSGLLTLGAVVASGTGSASAVAVAVGGNRGTGIYGSSFLQVAVQGKQGARFDGPGSSAPSSLTVMTREKGDARYIQESDAAAAQGAGYVGAAGALNRSRGIINGASRVATGNYRITLSRNVGNAVIIASPITASGTLVAQIANVQNNRFDVQIRTLGGGASNAPFSCVIY